MFRFDWAALTREEGDKLRQHLNERFVALEDRPAFMGPIEVVELEFGEQPPNLEMLDIRDADPEESEVALGDSFTGDDSDSLRLGASVSVVGEGSIYGDDDFDDTRSECSGFSLRSLSRLPAHSPFLVQRGVRSEYRDDDFVDTFSRSMASTSVRSVGCGNNDAPTRLTWRNVLDTGLHFHGRLRYAGDASLKIQTQLLVNFPVPAFVCIPVSLRVSQIRIDAVLDLTVRRTHIRFAIQMPDDPTSDPGLDEELSALRESTSFDMRIESEIGEDNEQVLKNLASIEQFIVLQLRRILAGSLSFSIPI